MKFATQKEPSKKDGSHCVAGSLFNADGQKQLIIVAIAQLQ
ncbi:hypothetical protein [Neobacillus bataviensis]|nr:hypothetical protein [Neobacillus bataviensis]